MPKLKSWSISTTVRSPDRLCGFLFMLASMEGEEWNNSIQVDNVQINFQTMWFWSGFCYCLAKRYT